MTVWTVKGGQRGQLEDRLVQHGLIGGGWEALSSLADVPSPDALAGMYAPAYPDVSKHAAAVYVGRRWSLIHGMQEGDLVVRPLKTTGTVAVGRVKDVPRDALE